MSWQAQCDSLIKNFDEISNKRQSEIEARFGQDVPARFQSQSRKASKHPCCVALQSELLVVLQALTQSKVVLAE